MFRIMTENNIPNVLLLGNGINRAFGESSWDAVIDGLSTGEFDYKQEWMEKIKTLPIGLQAIVISSDSVSDGMSGLSEKLMPYKLKEDHASLLRRLMSVPFDAILTTNYSYEIETSLLPQFKVRKGCTSKYRTKTKDENKNQKRFGIFRYYDIADKQIWHIHGEAAHPSSMVMGHYYYGKLLGEIQKRIPGLIREYKMCVNKDIRFVYKSWVDFFLLGNVYVLGFGMDPSEIDIWWLVNCKKRNFGDFGKIYLYEPNLESNDKYAVKALCGTFNIWHDKTRVKGDKQYIDYYNTIVNELQGLIL